MENNKVLKKAIKISAVAIVLFFAVIGILTTVVAVAVFRQPKELLTAVSTYQLIQSSFYEKVDPEILLEGLSYGMTESLDDPYSKYYTSEELAVLNSQITGKYAGIGLMLGLDKETELVKAIKVFKDSPAARAGLLPGDILIEINGEATDGLGTEEVAGKVRGTIGTSVELSVYRNGELLEFNLTRAEVTAPSVSVKYLEQGEDVLYIEITSFSSNTGQELGEQLASLDREPKSVILDLRDNGGGLVAQAIESARYFIPGGTVFFETGRDQTKLEEYKVSSERFLNVPIVVLVNSNSASASEILAGAIQDHGSGTLVGETTYGKAVVQTVFPMPTGGALKLTTKRYLTPDKRDLSKKGLTPDVEIIPSVEDLQKIDYTKMPDLSHDLVLLKALEVLGN